MEAEPVFLKKATFNITSCPCRHNRLCRHIELPKVYNVAMQARAFHMVTSCMEVLSYLTYDNSCKLAPLTIEDLMATRSTQRVLECTSHLTDRVHYAVSMAGWVYNDQYPHQRVYIIDADIKKQAVEVFAEEDDDIQ